MFLFSCVKKQREKKNNETHIHTQILSMMTKVYQLDCSSNLCSFILLRMSNSITECPWKFRLIPTYIFVSLLSFYLFLCFCFGRFIHLHLMFATWLSSVLEFSKVLLSNNSVRHGSVFFLFLNVRMCCVNIFRFNWKIK